MRDMTMMAGLIERRLTRLLLLVVMVVAAVPSAASEAWGQAPDVRDARNDVRGRAVLDLAAVGQGQRDGSLVHTVTTYERWRPALLSRGGEISLYFDTNADGTVDRRLDVLHADGGLSVVATDRKGRIVGGGLVRQSGPRTLEVEFARSLLGKAIRRYRWFAFAGFRCRHEYRTCGDTAPGRGKWISHDLAATAPPPEPRALVGLGYQPVYDEQFPDLSGWTRRIWYEEPPAAGAVSVQQGNLLLKARKADGWKNVTATTMGRRSFLHGYFEARMRWTKGAGAWPAFWLFSYRHATNPSWPSINPYCAQNSLPAAQCYSAELDTFEGQGREPTIFYGTIHRNSSQDYGQGDQQNSNNWHDVGVDLTAAFHRYGMLWTATQIKWYLDDQLVGTAPVYDSTNQPMFLILYMWIGGWTGGVDATTPDELVTEVDWVRVWQKSKQ